MVKKGNSSFVRNIFSMVLMSLFVAIYGVLSLLRIYIIPNELRLSLTFMPVAWASILFGPIAGGITGALGDIVGWVINPVGPFSWLHRKRVCFGNYMDCFFTGINYWKELFCLLP